MPGGGRGHRTGCALPRGPRRRRLRARLALRAGPAHGRLGRKRHHLRPRGRPAGLHARRSARRRRGRLRRRGRRHGLLLRGPGDPDGPGPPPLRGGPAGTLPGPCSCQRGAGLRGQHPARHAHGPDQPAAQPEHPAGRGGAVPVRGHHQRGAQRDDGRHLPAAAPGAAVRADPAARRGPHHARHHLPRGPAGAAPEHSARSRDPAGNGAHGVVVRRDCGARICSAGTRCGRAPSHGDSGPRDLLAGRRAATPRRAGRALAAGCPGRLSTGRRGRERLGRGTAR